MLQKRYPQRLQNHAIVAKRTTKTGFELGSRFVTNTTLHGVTQVLHHRFFRVFVHFVKTLRTAASLQNDVWLLILAHHRLKIVGRFE